MYIPMNVFRICNISLSVFTLCAACLIFGQAAIAEESQYEFEILEENTVKITGYNGPSDGELVIPAEINGLPVSVIARGVFSNSSFTTVRIPENVTYISTSAFTRQNGNLRDVYLPSTLEHIMRRSFDYTAQFHVHEDNETFRSVDGILFSRDMTRMKAFPSGRTGEYTIPESVTWIRGDVFRNSQLTNIHIHDGVTYFGRLAFNGMENLTEIRLPASLDTLGERGKQFENCVNLESIIIPDGVTTLYREIFKGCTSLASVTLPENLQTIHYGAFRDCISLTSIVLPDSISVMHYGVFRGCENLTHVSLPASLTFIADRLFQDCISLARIVIPASVTTIGDRSGYAFSGCDALTKIYFLGDAPEVRGSQNFPVRLPGQSPIVIYHTADATGWPEFGELQEWHGFPTREFHPDDLE